MSAIFGVVDFENRMDLDTVGSRMLRELGKYPMEALSNEQAEHVVLGCGLQYSTPESLQEALPLRQNGGALLLTADAIIDNREELIKLLELDEAEYSGKPDSVFILQAYKRWGTDCPRYLVGDFAFAIWDVQKNELFCVRDHTGSRTLYYYQDKGIFSFSTVIKPLFHVMDAKPGLNERWIVDFLALPGVIQECECDDTVYEEIRQLEPAHYIRVGRNGIRRVKYWEPLKKLKTLRLKSDEEYREAFRKVLYTAVQCRLRSCGEVGIKLSGGLDSGTIGCIAAKQLENENRRLKAFTSIPFEGFANPYPEQVITDESEYIREIIERHANIDHVFTRSEGKHSLSDTDFDLEMLEQPYKVIENIFWYKDILEKSSAANCRILLHGSYGNHTISYGDSTVCILTMFRQLRFRRMHAEIRAYCRKKRCSGKSVYKQIFKSVLPEELFSFKKNIRRVRAFLKFSLKSNSSRKYTNQQTDKENGINSGETQGNMLLKLDMIRKWKLGSRYKRKGIIGAKPFQDINGYHRRIVDPMGFSQMALFETKLGLSYHVYMRDPSRDKRVIEFCLSLPIEQFVRNGTERYLLRMAMNGILPDKIRLLEDKRGLQAADWIQRMAVDWEDKKEELAGYLKGIELEKFIGVNKLLHYWAESGNILKDNIEGEFKIYIICYVLSKFFQDNEGGV